MATPSWFRDILKHMRYPDHYVVFDVETTGLIHTTDLITQLGYCVVCDRKPIENGSMLLDWTRHKGVDQPWLYNRIDETVRRMASKGKTCHTEYAKLREQGIDPHAALEQFFALLADARARGDAFVAHNAWAFDIPMLHAHAGRFASGAFQFLPDEVYDTGVMEKANQMYAFPRQGETRQAFYKRIHAARMHGVTWSLDSYCMPHYGLIEKYGLDASKAHDAGFDCLATHHLFETFRELSEGGTEVECAPSSSSSSDSPAEPLASAAALLTPLGV